MVITRRQFVAYVAGATTSGVAGVAFDPGPRGAVSRRWLLVDLQQHCSLRESLVGYETALRVQSIRVAGLSLPLSACAGLIVPGALRIPPRVCRAIATCLQAGATVLLESGAGFAAGPDVRAHRAMLRGLLDVRTEAPVQLWTAAGHARSGAMPYIDYAWPSPTKVRDFSRVVPLEREGAGEIIAWVGGLPVALKRRTGGGGGTLIFLGSPLGPALWAGDAEARRWLFDVTLST